MSAPIGVRLICAPPMGGRKLIPRPWLVNRSPSRSRTSSSSATVFDAGTGAALSAPQIGPAASNKSATVQILLIAASPGCQMDRSLPQDAGILSAKPPNFNLLTPNLRLNLLAGLLR